MAATANCERWAIACGGGGGGPEVDGGGIGRGRPGLVAIAYGLDNNGCRNLILSAMASV